jgi:hypothetical protein
MGAPLPPAFRCSDEQLWDEVRATRRLDPDQRAALLESLCELGAELVSQHPDPARTLAWQDPLAPETAQLLARLRARRRG